MRNLQLGFRRRFDGHDGLIFETSYVADIVTRDVSVSFVFVEQLQLEFGVANQVVELILFGFQIG